MLASIQLKIPKLYANKKICCGFFFESLITLLIYFLTKFTLDAPYFVPVLNFRNSSIPRFPR